MAKYRHIVFDVDGTLIDTRDCILYSLQEMLMTVKGERRKGNPRDKERRDKGGF